MKSIKLPFSLPVDLLVTQIDGASPSHKTGRAIDLAPIIDETDKRARIVIYTNTYLRLCTHLKGGVFRINNSSTCWHYHYFNTDAWEFGYEQYFHKWGHCKEFGPPSIVDMRSPLASTRFMALMQFVTTQLMGSISPNAIDFILNLWKEVNLSDKKPTLLYFPDKIPEQRVRDLMSNFSPSLAWLPNQAWTPVNVADIEAASARLWLWVALIGAGAYMWVTRKD